MLAAPTICTDIFTFVTAPGNEPFRNHRVRYFSSFG